MLHILTEQYDEEERGGEDGDAEEHVVEVAAHQLHRLLRLVAPDDRRGQHETQGDAQLQYIWRQVTPCPYSIACAMTNE